VVLIVIRSDHQSTIRKPLAETLRAELNLLPGGHFTPLDCPMEVVAALRDFLSLLPAEH